MEAKKRGRKTEDRGRTDGSTERRAAVRQALAKAHGCCPLLCGSRGTGHESQASASEPRVTGHESRTAPCCADCVFAVPLQDGERELLVCTGCPMCPGRMRVTQECECCRAFQKRRRQTGRTVPPEPTDESIRYIPLTKGKYAIIDAADYERVAEHKWCTFGSGERLYACRNCKGKMVSLHRFLTNAPKGKVVDHIDGNGLNDRRANLRVCTHRQNSHNARPFGKASRFKGVWWNKNRKMWEVRIRHRGRNVQVGLFLDEVEAARAYDRKAYECFGQYAYLNFPYEIAERCRRAG